MTYADEIDPYYRIYLATVTAWHWCHELTWSNFYDISFPPYSWHYEHPKMYAVLTRWVRRAEAVLWVFTLAAGRIYQLVREEETEQPL